MSRTPLLAIAHQTVRQAIRSRMAVTLMLTALVFVLVMPLALRDDGTLEGRFRVLTVYALNGAFSLIVIAALWSACAAVATELSSRRLHLVHVKPVSAATLWFGKWLGLMGLHGFILGLTWIVILGQLAVRIPQAFSNGEAGIPRTSQVLRAQPTGADQVDDAADDARHIHLAPGQTQTIVFKLPRARGNAVLEFRFTSSRLRDAEATHDLPLFIDIGGASRINRERLSGRFHPGRLYRIDSIPVTGWESDQLYVAIQNVSATPPTTLLLDVHDGIRLRIPHGGLLQNHLRGAAILLIRLGVFIAVGLTAGTLFSFPVAAFAGGFWLLFAALAGYIRSVLAVGVLHIPHDAPIEEPGLMDHLIMSVFRVFDVILWPMRDPSVIPMLGDNTLIPANRILMTLALLTIGYFALSALIGILALRHRELGAGQ